MALKTNKGCTKSYANIHSSPPITMGCWSLNWAFQEGVSSCLTGLLTAWDTSGFCFCLCKAPPPVSVLFRFLNHNSRCDQPSTQTPSHHCSRYRFWWVKRVGGICIFCALRAHATLLCSSATAIPAEVGRGCFSAEHLRLFLFVAAVGGREGQGIQPLEISDTNVLSPSRTNNKSNWPPLNRSVCKFSDPYSKYI